MKENTKVTVPSLVCLNLILTRSDMGGSEEAMVVVPSATLFSSTMSIPGLYTTLIGVESWLRDSLRSCKDDLLLCWTEGEPFMKE